MDGLCATYLFKKQYFLYINPEGVDQRFTITDCDPYMKIKRFLLIYAWNVREKSVSDLPANYRPLATKERQKRFSV